MARFLERNNFYFKKFPRVTYNFYGYNKEVLNFIHRWAFRKRIKESAAAFSKWLIRDQDTLLSVSKAVYGSQHYYWIVMMMNDMLDPIFDWPMNESDLYNYVISIYGEENVNATHHTVAGVSDDLYKLPIGTIVSSNYISNIENVSNFEYESGLNEAKRPIKLLRPEYLEQVEKEKNAILASNFNGAV